MTVYSGPGSVEYQGRVLRESQSIKINFASNNKDVNTLVLGHSGHTPGPKMVTADVSNAIPSEADGGLEFDAPAAILAQAEIELTYVCGGKRYTIVGDLRDGDLSTESEGAANSVSFKHVGRIASIV